MGKIYDTTDFIDPSFLTSQTPKNFNRDNFYLDTMQKKLDYDWDVRFNKVDIEEETGRGTNQFSPIEVVIQTVKNTKGETISDDWRNLVFRDIRKYVPLGTKFRFSYRFDLNEPNEDKSVWLATNNNFVTATSGVVAVRCNGTLGSTYLDSRGVTQFHYEPVIQTRDLKTVGLFYSKVALEAQGDLIGIVQHNEFTKNYTINQRFILGYDTTFRITGLQKFNSLSTYHAEDIPIIILYLTKHEEGDRDNFETRIAYNDKQEIVVIEEPEQDYKIKLVSPAQFPAGITSVPTAFEAVLYSGENPTPTQVEVQCTLSNVENPEEFFEFQRTGATTFFLRRKRFYGGGMLLVTCFVTGATLGIAEDVALQFSLNLRELE